MTTTIEFGKTVRPVAPGERVAYTRDALGRPRRAQPGTEADAVMLPPRCSRWITQGRATYACGRDAVAEVEGQGYMCKQHLTGWRRRRRNDEARAAARRAERDGAEAARDRLHAALRALGADPTGIDLHYVTSGTRMGHYSTTRAVVPIALLEALAARVST